MSNFCLSFLFSFFFFFFFFFGHLQVSSSAGLRPSNLLGNEAAALLDLTNSNNNNRQVGGSCQWLSPREIPKIFPNVQDLGDMLDCNLRTLNSDLYLNSSDMSRADSVRLRCNDKLYFESYLVPNVSIFGMTNLRAVSIESCKLRKIPGNVWAAGLTTSSSSLKSLKIVTKNGEWSTSVSLELENEAFEGLGALSELDLSENNIWSLPETTFCPLRSLVRLNLSRNRLSELEELNPGSPEANFCTLNVQNVDLSFNSLRRVGRIVKWKQITELWLQNNFIEELDDGAFSELHHLRALNLSSNRLVALPPVLFKMNPSLRELYLSNNSISALAPAVFSGLDQLVMLDLSRNTLSSQWIREKMFGGLRRLISLRLSYNQLSYVDSSIFRDLVNLQVINLDNNRIEACHPDAFAQLRNLRALDLSNNRITMTDSRLFGSLKGLKQLYLDHNKIRTIPDELLTNCTSLQDLGLADNLLQEVPVALRKGLPVLQTLDIGENRITSIANDSFAGLGQLFGLRMVDNRLTEVPRGFCDPLVKLRVLNLAQNRIHRISPNAFETCPELRALRLDTNVLEDLPLTLVRQLPSLLWLNVSENRLNSINYASIPPTVEWLDLSHNRLTTIGGETMSKNFNHQLRVMDLSYNQLRSLDYTMIPPSVETLRVNHNRVKSVASDSFIRSSRLRRVELMANELETLPVTALRFPPIPQGRPLPEFYLAMNPFLCDCSMEWLTRVTQLSALRQHPRIVDIDSITCSPVFAPHIKDPNNNNNDTATTGSSNNNGLISLRTAKSSNFLCAYKSHCFALCHCCDFDACDCEMTCPGNCTCYHDTAWSRNVVHCSAGNHEDIPKRIPMDATEIHLDGNHITQLSSHTFIGKKNLKTLYLNSSRLEYINNKTFNGLRSLQVLHLQDNLLTELQGYEFTDIENLKVLYLQNNLIRQIASNTFEPLKSLEVLRLDGNLLLSFNVWELNSHGSLNSLMLTENPWSCDCEFVVEFRTWILSHSTIVPAWTAITCRSQDAASPADHLKTSISTVCNNGNAFNNNNPGSDSFINTQDVRHHDIIIENHHEIDQEGDSDDGESSTFNPAIIQQRNSNGELTMTRPGNNEIEDSSIFWTLILTCSGFAILLIFLVILFRREIWDRVQLVNIMDMCFFCCNGGSSAADRKKSSGGSAVSASSADTDKLFDAYFLYSKKDEELLLEKIAPELEHGLSGGNNFFRLCLHHRDLCLNPTNPWNYEMIQSACDASKRVVMLLSQSFFNSELANNESYSAIQYALSRCEMEKKLITILIPPLTENNLSNFLPGIEPHAKASSRYSRLEWADKNFWSKFKLLLPTPSILSSSSPDHPMLIPATYTISRHHPPQRSSNCNLPSEYGPHFGQFSSLEHPARNHHYIHEQQQHHAEHPRLPSYSQEPPPHHQQHQHQQQPPPNYTNSNNVPLPPVPPFWPSKEANTTTHHSRAAVHPISQLTPQTFLSFNESFKRHQQQAQQHHHNSQRLPKPKKPHHSHHSQQQHQHHHQDSNCSNMSNNSRMPLNASPGYSSSVETNLSSSTEELDHVYSTLDSPLQSPKAPGNNNGGGAGGKGEHLAAIKLINPYSPTNINNNGDPTMYFV